MSRILNVGANFYLDVYGSNTAPGTKVIVYTLNDPKTPNQEVSQRERVAKIILLIFLQWYVQQDGSTNQVKLYVNLNGRKYIRIDVSIMHFYASSSHIFSF